MKFLLSCFLIFVCSITYADDVSDYFGNNSARDYYFGNNIAKDYYFGKKSKGVSKSRSVSKLKPKPQVITRYYLVDNPNAADRFYFEGKTYFVPNGIRVEPQFILICIE